jgi:SAM-dependent methyltransferase
VLWDELIDDWQLSPFEAGYINRQQGHCCAKCGNNMRSMALASAITHGFGFRGTMLEFSKTARAQEIRVLEINESGGLTPLLSKFPKHKLIRYPEHDMTNLSIPPDSFDLVLHSDTLEHVNDPVAGLAECRRVLVESGRCIFTVPIVIGRLSRSRAGLKSSFHGRREQANSDYIVHTEFGADVWKYAMEAGFANVRIHCLEYPSALAIVATK